MFIHNGSNYDNHFIIKALAKDSEGEFNCLEENTEKYKTFPVPITKEVKRITRFMVSLLSNLVDNLAEGIHKVKCKYGHDKKTVKRVKLNTKILTALLNVQTLKMI